VGSLISALLQLVSEASGLDQNFFMSVPCEEIRVTEGNKAMLCAAIRAWEISPRAVERGFSKLGESCYDLVITAFIRDNIDGLRAVCFSVNSGGSRAILLTATGDAWLHLHLYLPSPHGENLFGLFCAHFQPAEYDNMATFDTEALLTVIGGAPLIKLGESGYELESTAVNCDKMDGLRAVRIKRDNSGGSRASFWDYKVFYKYLTCDGRLYSEAEAQRADAMFKFIPETGNILRVADMDNFKFDAVYGVARQALRKYNLVFFEAHLSSVLDIMAVSFGYLMRCDQVVARAELLRALQGELYGRISDDTLDQLGEIARALYEHLRVWEGDGRLSETETSTRRVAISNFARLSAADRVRQEGGLRNWDEAPTQSMIVDGALCGSSERQLVIFSEGGIASKTFPVAEELRSLKEQIEQLEPLMGRCLALEGEIEQVSKEKSDEMRSKAEQVLKEKSDEVRRKAEQVKGMFPFDPGTRPEVGGTEKYSRLEELFEKKFNAVPRVGDEQSGGDNLLSTVGRSKPVDERFIPVLESELQHSFIPPRHSFKIVATFRESDEGAFPAPFVVTPPSGYSVLVGSNPCDNLPSKDEVFENESTSKSEAPREERLLRCGAAARVHTTGEWLSGLLLWLGLLGQLGCEVTSGLVTGVWYVIRGLMELIVCFALSLLICGVAILGGELPGARAERAKLVARWRIRRLEGFRSPVDHNPGFLSHHLGTLWRRFYEPARSLTSEEEAEVSDSYLGGHQRERQRVEEAWGQVQGIHKVSVDNEEQRWLGRFKGVEAEYARLWTSREQQREEAILLSHPGIFKSPSRHSVEAVL